MKKPFYTGLSLTGIVAAIAFLQAQSQPADRLAPEIIGRLSARGLAEVSRMARSRSYANTYWVVSDS